MSDLFRRTDIFPMLEHLRKFIKNLFKWGEAAIPRTRMAARLGLLGSLRLTHRFLARVSQAPPPLPEDKPRPGVPAPLPKLIWVIANIEWEKYELVPELKKFCDVAVTDLSKVIHGSICRDEVFKLVEADAKKIASPDLIFLYAREGLLSAELFQLLRLKGVPIWGMNLDDKTEFLKDEDLPYNGRYGYSRWVNFFDLNLSSSRAMLDQYRQLKARVLYCAEGYYDRPEFFTDRPPTLYPLSFVGAVREDRQDLIQAIRHYGYKPAIFGAGWPDTHPAEAPWKVFRASQISLGIGFSSPSRATALKGRDFECTGANACYLTTYNWEICEHFEVGREILCYRCPEELVEMLSYYLHRPEECARIAAEGLKRARAHHTWEQRFRKAFEFEYR